MQITILKFLTVVCKKDSMILYQIISKNNIALEAEIKKTFP